MYTLPNNFTIAKFKLAIEQFCADQHYHNFKLNDDELEQLSWYMGNECVTPEAKPEEIYAKLDFEIQRSLARRYSFELLLRGNLGAYEEFIQAQDQKIPLTFASFKMLAQEAQSLSDEMKTAIRVSCFLTTNTRARKELKEHDIVLSADSEEFLSQLPAVLLKNKLLFPISRTLTQKPLELLQKVFWPNTHLRHMLYTEGSDNMTKSLSDGVVNKTFTAQDFTVWKWRWLTNLFGFQVARGAIPQNRGASYFNQENFTLTFHVLEELEKVIANPTYSYLDNYLLKRASVAGLTTDYTITEQQLLGHVAAYFHKVNILNTELGQPILAAYNAFKQKCNSEESLAKLYESHRKDAQTVTPTYVPAVCNNAFDIFRGFGQSPLEAIYNASLYTFELLQRIYSMPHNQRFSCLEMAQMDNLKPVLKEWLKAPEPAFSPRP